MPEFIIIYHGFDQPDSKEAGEAARGRWAKWMQDLGENIVNFGTPFKAPTIIGKDGSTRAGGLSGYSVVKAESMDAAMEIAKACPHLEMGEVEVAELVAFKME
ncbi:MAG: hypothetical protein COB08_018320 [Rhodobacteraceae bacterium]|nr:hypothetical protein [Paracoccaceae bacterium]